MIMRTVAAILACSALSLAQLSPKTATGTYHFTTPQTVRSLQQAAMIVGTVALAADVSTDISTATLTFSGSAEAADFAEWMLPQIDKTVGDDAVHQYGFPSGGIGRVKFVPNVPTEKNIQELITILRTVADVAAISPFKPNHAIVLCGPDWQVNVAEWIIDMINQRL